MLGDKQYLGLGEHRSTTGNSGIRGNKMGRLVAEGFSRGAAAAGAGVEVQLCTGDQSFVRWLNGIGERGPSFLPKHALVLRIK